MSKTTPYRTIWVNKKVENSKAFDYLLCNKPINSSNYYLYCGICRSSKRIVHSINILTMTSNDEILKVTCNPKKRINVGSFFRRNTCPVGGFHCHYICQECKYHTLEMYEVNLSSM